MCSFWKKLGKISKAGDAAGSSQNYHYSVLSEGYVDGSYQWEIKIESVLDSNSLEISVDQYLDTIEASSERGFDTLGIREFENLQLLNQSGEQTDYVILEPLDWQKIVVRTCDLRNNKLFKHYQPVVQLNDKILN